MLAVPEVDFRANFQAAFQARGKANPILREMIALRRGAGKLSPNEYFYYRAWDPGLSRDEQHQFVGKQAQYPMHLACNDPLWYATAADKLLFHTVMAGAGLPGPELLASTAANRGAPGAVVLPDKQAIATFLRDAGRYPLFVKPVDGKFSVAVVSADRFDSHGDRVELLGGQLVSPEDIAAKLVTRKAGFLLQRRLAPHPALAARFGPRLWSVRILLLLTPSGPHIHRAVAKIATGHNPADNLWRAGNMVAAIQRQTGCVTRVVRGTGAAMELDPVHPDTGAQIVGTHIPAWDQLIQLVHRAALLLPGIRTQSWDIALTDAGPMPLEVNVGGDFNLCQLACGAGVLDDDYRAHLRSCGYKI